MRFFGVVELAGSSISKLWGVEVVELSGFGGSCRAVCALTARVFRARARFRSRSGSIDDRPTTSFVRPSSTCHGEEAEGDRGGPEGYTTSLLPLNLNPALPPTLTLASHTNSPLPHPTQSTTSSLTLPALLHTISPILKNSVNPNPHPHKLTLTHPHKLTLTPPSQAHPPPPHPMQVRDPLPQHQLVPQEVGPQQGLGELGQSGQQASQQHCLLVREGQQGAKLLQDSL